MAASTRVRVVPLFCLVVTTFTISAQTFPSAPNQRNSKGQKEGRWIEYYDSKNRPTTNPDSIVLYDDVTFRAGKPVGLYRSFYRTGVLESEGKLTNEELWTQDSLWTYYRPDGEKKVIEVYTDEFFDGDKTADEMIGLSDQLKKKYGVDHEYFLKSIFNANNLMMSWHADEKGERFLQRTLTEAIGKVGADSKMCYCALTNLGNFYNNKGSKAKAITYLEQAVQLAPLYPEDVCGGFHPLVMLGATYLDTDQTFKAKEYLEKGIEAVARRDGRDSPEARLSLQYYYWYYNNEGLLKEAGEVAREMWTGALKQSGSEAYIHSWIQYAMARQYKDTGNYQEAEKIYRRIGQPGGWPEQLAYFLIDQKKYAEAYPIMVKEIDFKMSRMMAAFQFQSEVAREQYYNGRFYERANSYLTLLAAYSRERPSCIEDMYNFHLVNKAILLNSSAKWKQRIKQSGDVKLINLYAEWEAVNRQINNSESQETPALIQLKNKNENLEKLLTKRSHLFTRSEERKVYRWTDVRDQLKKDEAAVEIIRYGKRAPVRYFNNGTRLIPQYKISDTIQYALLVVRPGDKHPAFTLLENGIDLEGRSYKQYMNSIRANVEDVYSWQTYWEPIRKMCKGAKKIYISTDGIYTKINLNTLRNNDTKRFVIEDTQLVQVTSTKDLLMRPADEAVNKYAILVGNADYSKRRQPLQDLPGTKKEVELVSAILRQHEWTVDSYQRENALEENIKDAFKPGILHVATHGFFHEKESEVLSAVDVLTRSGLVLSVRSDSVNAEDGTLTAYESMNLNLDETELVVLSACETAGGEFKNSEGIYGLQRAFRVAGAKSLIMSLWQVEDERTGELMIDFYRLWLGGSDKVSSFRTAQLNMIKKTRDPHVWGGFVMLGM